MNLQGCSDVVPTPGGNCVDTIQLTSELRYTTFIPTNDSQSANGPTGMGDYPLPRSRHEFARVIKTPLSFYGPRHHSEPSSHHRRFSELHSHHQDSEFDPLAFPSDGIICEVSEGSVCSGFGSSEALDSHDDNCRGPSPFDFGSFWGPHHQETPLSSYSPFQYESSRSHSALSQPWTHLSFDHSRMNVDSRTRQKVFNFDQISPPSASSQLPLLLSSTPSHPQHLSQPDSKYDQWGIHGTVSPGNKLGKTQMWNNTPQGPPPRPIGKQNDPTSNLSSASELSSAGVSSPALNLGFRKEGDSARRRSNTGDRPLARQASAQASRLPGGSNGWREDSLLHPGQAYSKTALRDMDNDSAGPGGSATPPQRLASKSSESSLATEPPDAPRLPPLSDVFEDSGDHGFEDLELTPLYEELRDSPGPHPAAPPPSTPCAGSLSQHQASKGSTCLTLSSIRKLEILQHQRSYALRGTWYPGHPPSPLGPNWARFHGKREVT